jgi:hypothetical protein
MSFALSAATLPDAPLGALRVRSVNVGVARPLMAGGRRVLSGIGKQAVVGPVAVGRLGLAGDEQADLSVHGGLDKAVYAYPAEHAAFWQARRQEHGVSLFHEVLPPGFWGENLSLEGPGRVAGLGRRRTAFPRLRLARDPRRASPATSSTPSWATPRPRATWCWRAAAAFTWRSANPVRSQPANPSRWCRGRRALDLPQAFAARRFKHLR